MRVGNSDVTGTTSIIAVNTLCDTRSLDTPFDQIHIKYVCAVPTEGKYVTLQKSANNGITHDNVLEVTQIDVYVEQFGKFGGKLELCEFC